MSLEISTGDPDVPAIAIGRLSNTFAGLPERFFVRQTPAQVARPGLVKFNNELAAELGLDVGAMNQEDLAALFAGNILAAGSEPIAMAYAGHQFGNFVPQLGDGRAILLGEIVDRSGNRRDIQLKGAGRTAFSRGGDGRAALGPVLREYLVSEAMHALGIPTTRALAAVTTGEGVVRERYLPGAVLTRILASNIRVGTFQYFAARGDEEAVRLLADTVIARHYPELKGAANPYLALLSAVMERQAALVANWLNVGFVHGVMNTDNMAISGETIDFGPCAFLDDYDPAKVFSSIDQQGRYAFGNQPYIAQWNIARFAETLLPLFDSDEKRGIELATETINGFVAIFENFWLRGMREKIGLRREEAEDRRLIHDLLDALRKNRVDFTVFFRRLGDAVTGASDVRGLFETPEAFEGWAVAWRARLDAEPMDGQARAAAMRRKNPAFIPRNHLVERALEATMEGDFQHFNTLLEILHRPFEDQPEFADYAVPLPPGCAPYVTYCGT
jgi:serine/tyrosine/threonine adenylyltransferase